MNFNMYVKMAIKKPSLTHNTQYIKFWAYIMVKEVRVLMV